MKQELVTATLFHAMMFGCSMAIIKVSNAAKGFHGTIEIGWELWLVLLVSPILTALLLRRTRERAQRLTSGLRRWPVLRMAATMGGTVLIVGLVISLPLIAIHSFAASLLAIALGVGIGAIAGASGALLGRLI